MSGSPSKRAKIEDKPTGAAELSIEPKNKAYMNLFDATRKRETVECKSNVKDEVEAIIRKLNRKLKNSAAIIENVIKIQLAAPDIDFSQFYDLAYENEVLSKALVDLKTISKEIECHLQQSDSHYSFSVDEKSPAMVLTGCIIEKEKLLKNIKRMKEADNARCLLRTLVPSSSLRDANSLNFDTKTKEANLLALKKHIDNFDFRQF